MGGACPDFPPLEELAAKGMGDPRAFVARFGREVDKGFGDLAPEAPWRELGEHQLRGLEGRQRVVAPG